MPPTVRCRSFGLLDSFGAARSVTKQYESLMTPLAQKTGEVGTTWLKARPKGLFRTLEKASGFKGKVAFFGETVSWPCLVV